MLLVILENEQILVVIFEAHRSTEKQVKLISQQMAAWLDDRKGAFAVSWSRKLDK